MELKEVRGYWNHNFTTNQYSYTLNGSIMVEEDGWFEGYIKQMNFGKKDSEIGLAFGICENDQVLELFYCVGDFIYRFQMYQIQDYVGYYSSIGPMMEQLLGQCFIKLKSSSSLHMDTVFSKTKLSLNFISDRGKNFYQQLRGMRTEMIKACQEKSHCLDSSFILLDQLLDQIYILPQTKMYHK